MLCEKGPGRSVTARASQRAGAGSWRMCQRGQRDNNRNALKGRTRRNQGDPRARMKEKWLGHSREGRRAGAELCGVFRSGGVGWLVLGEAEQQRCSACQTRSFPGFYWG